MRNILLWASGADRETLEQCRTPDRVTYAGLGGAVLTTAFTAFIAATFKTQMEFDAPLLVALGMGAAWCLIILNLDRWLVTAIKRRPTFWRNLGIFLPRLALSVLLGFIIAEPLVLRMFEPEIEEQLVVMQEQRTSEFTEELAENPEFARIPELEARAVELQSAVDGQIDSAEILNDAEVADLNARLTEIEKQLAVAEQDVICEREGTCGSGRVGAGPAWEEKIELRDRLRSERDGLAAELAAKKEEVANRLAEQAEARRASAAAELSDVETQLTELRDERSNVLSVHESASQANDGLLARLEALGQLRENSSTVQFSYFMHLAFIIAIDVLAVLIKFFMFLGPESLYEKLLARTEDDIDQRHERQLRDESEIERLEAEIPLLAAQSRFDLEQEAAERFAKLVADRAAEKQEEVLDYLLEGWKRRMIEDIDNDLDAYIT